MPIENYPTFQEVGAAVGQVPEYCEQITRWVMEVAKIPVIVKLTPNITNIVSPARAAVAACMEAEPAFFKMRAHSLSVAPVVSTSSTKSTRKPRTSIFLRKRNAPRKFSMRSERSNAVWVVV